MLARLANIRRILIYLYFSNNHYCIQVVKAVIVKSILLYSLSSDFGLERDGGSGYKVVASAGNGMF